MEELKISIITASYNQGEFIEETIKSVLAQNYKNFEHIVIDGGSKDNTLKILKKYKHLKWVSEKDKGQSDALNKGFKKAQGEIICWLNSDDTLEKGTFKKINVFFIKHPDYDIIEGGLNIINKEGKLIKYVPPRRISVNSLLNELGSVNQPSTFFRRKLLTHCGYVDENINCCMDHDLFLRFLLKGSKVGITDSSLANFRVYATTKTSLLEKNFLQDKIMINKRYNGKKLNLHLFKAYFRLYIILRVKKLIGRNRKKY